MMINSKSISTSFLTLTLTLLFTHQLYSQWDPYIGITCNLNFDHYESCDTVPYSNYHTNTRSMNAGIVADQELFKGCQISIGALYKYYQSSILLPDNSFLKNNGVISNAFLIPIDIKTSFKVYDDNSYRIGTYIGIIPSLSFTKSNPPLNGSIDMVVNQNSISLFYYSAGRKNEFYCLYQGGIFSEIQLSNNALLNFHASLAYGTNTVNLIYENVLYNQFPFNQTLTHFTNNGGFIEVGMNYMFSVHKILNSRRNHY